MKNLDMDSLNPIYYFPVDAFGLDMISVEPSRVIFKAPNGKTYSGPCEAMQHKISFEPFHFSESEKARKFSEWENEFGLTEVD